jgi:histidinol-phosphate aminotransferase
LAQRALAGRTWPPGTLWLNANENPEGPPAAAIEAIRRLAGETWRYHFEAFRDFYATVARSERLEPEQVLVGAGSTELLSLAVLVFTSATRPLIYAHPTFEAPPELAKALGRPSVPIPLAPPWAADVKRMAAEADRAGGGLIYLCNPNNPTSSLTPTEDLAWLVSNLPRNTVVLIDEAYLHFVEDCDARSALGWVRQGKNVIVTRTFSKIYGMAGLRAGFACANPELIAQLRPFRNNVISILSARAVEAALASAATMIPERRSRLIRIRQDLCNWLRVRNIHYIEPYANFVMIDVGDARRVASLLAGKNIAVGRPFPPLENLMRVTLGAESDMAKFKVAFAQVHPVG